MKLHEVSHSYDDQDVPKSEAEYRERERLQQIAHDSKVMHIIIDKHAHKYEIRYNKHNAEKLDQRRDLDGYFPRDASHGKLIIVLENLPANIKNLKGLPRECQQLIITNCNFESLAGIPDTVTGYLVISGMSNPIDVLPSKVEGDCVIKKSKLKSLSVLPKVIDGGSLELHDCGITSLSGIHKCVSFTDHDSNMGRCIEVKQIGEIQDVLGCLLVPGIREVVFDYSRKSAEAATLINELLASKVSDPHAPGMREVSHGDIIDLQTKMIEMGMEAQANL